MPSHPPSDAQNLDEQFRLVRVELRRRLLSGQECRLEDYFVAYPHLAHDTTRALELIRLEWSTRRDLGQRSTLQEYLSRFPQWENDLRSSLDPPATGEEVISSQATTKAGGVNQSTQTHFEEVPDVPSPASLDHHELLNFVGEGGMGVVHRAWDPILKRHVALKRIKVGTLAGPREVERFYREAQAAARLRHPNIVEIHGMGLYRGQHCFTMTLLSGGTLATRMESFRPPQKAAALLEKVARAVHAAHRQGVIHRDLKPSNVFLDADDEPLVGDFGLAKLIEPDVELSHPGVVIGTPAYMAPEQFSGDSTTVTARSDVWALGVLLYELLTGRRPFQAKTWQDFSHEVRKVAPPTPRTLEPSLDRDLDAIILKCLAKSPNNRFESADALADALRDWQQGKRIPRKSSPRKRHLLALGAILFLAVFGLIVAVNRRDRPTPDHLSEPPTVLLGDTGEPFREGSWAVGEPFSTKECRDPEKVFALKTKEIALYELTAKPPYDFFRLELEVKPELDVRSGQFGVYLARSLSPDQGMDWHTCLALGVSVNTVKLHVMTVKASNVLPVKNARHQTGINATRVEAPKGSDGWERLWIDVGPKTVTVWWNGEKAGSEARERLEKLSRDNFNGFLPVATSLDWEGGLGLYAVNGTALFRNATLRKLPRP